MEIVANQATQCLFNANADADAAALAAPYFQQDIIILWCSTPFNKPALRLQPSLHVHQAGMRFLEL